MSYRDTKNLLEYAASIDRSKRKLLANTIRDVLAEENPDIVIKPHMVGKMPTQNASFESAAAAANRAGGVTSPVVARALDIVFGEELGLRSGQYSQMVSSSLQNLRNLRDKTIENDRISDVLTSIRSPQTPPNVQLVETAGVRKGYPNYAEIDNRSVPIESAITRYTAPAEASFTDMRTGAIVPIKQVQVTDLTTSDPWRTLAEEIRVSPVVSSPTVKAVEIRALPPATITQPVTLGEVVQSAINSNIEKPSSLSDAIFQKEIANKAGYTDTSARRLFSPVEIDTALDQGRVAAISTGRAPVDIAGAFNRYGNLPAASFIDKIRNLTAIENMNNNVSTNTPIDDAVSRQFNRQMEAERGRFNAPVRGETVADKVRFLNQLNTSVPEASVPNRSFSLAADTPEGHRFYGKGTSRLATAAALATPFLAGAIANLIAKNNGGN